MVAMQKHAHHNSTDDFLVDKAIKLINDGLTMPAVDLLRQVLPRHSHNARLLYLAGTAEMMLENYSESAVLLQRSLSLNPNQADTLCNLGLALSHLNDFKKAEQAFYAAISLKPDYAEAYNNLSWLSLEGLNNPEQALAAAHKATLLAPTFCEAYINRGNALLAINRLEAALESYEKALLLNPRFAAAQNNRGNALHKLGRFDESIAAYQRAISLNPNDADAYCNMGICYSDMGQATEALDALQQSVSINPFHANAHLSLAGLADQAGDLDLRLSHLNAAIALKPDFAKAHWNKALLKLLQGDFKEGFQLYEWGWKCGFRGGDRGFSAPRWLGQTTLTGKRLLIHHEQGLGDAVQYARYVQMAVNMGADVIFETLAPLVPLLKTLVPPCQLITMGSPLPPFDYYTPLMSLPLAFGTTLSNMPPSDPYLFADPERVARWDQALGCRTMPRVGLVWSGSVLHKNDQNRSMSLKLLAPLLSLPFEFHSLQKEFRDDDLVTVAELPMVKTHADAISDFADTAALISLMDIVISVDTSVAHVAGALGKPFWLMLPATPDWRWLLNRADSPWYPSARLFRQSGAGEWEGVIMEIRAALNQLLPKVQ